MMIYELPDLNIRIMGSLHVVPAGEHVPRWAMDAYDWCDELVFESDPKALLQTLRPAPGISVKEGVRAKTWDTLIEIWPTEGPIPSIDAVQPWAVFLLSGIFAMATSDGVEPIFLGKAALDLKSVSFLETEDDIAAAFDQIPVQRIFDSLNEVASDLGAAQRVLEAMYRAWIAKDIAALFAAACRSPGFNHRDVQKAVLQVRNALWASRLKEAANSRQRKLIAVGALHLHGPKNLITLLGYEPKRVRL